MDYSNYDGKSDAYVARDFTEEDYYENEEWSDQWSNDTHSSGVKSRPARRANYSDRSGMDDGFVPLRPSANHTGRIGTNMNDSVDETVVYRDESNPRRGDSVVSGLTAGLSAQGIIADAALATASEKLGLSAQDVAAVKNLLAASQQATVQSSMLSFGFYRYYFRVDNQYVIAKLRRLFVPFLSNDIREWRRKLVSESKHTEQSDERSNNSGVLQSTNPDDRPLLTSKSDDSIMGPYFAAEKDVNAPDGYIPLMAVMTYILTMGLLTGTRKADLFSPQVLMKSASSAMGMLLFEVLLLKSGFWLISSSKVTVALLPSVVDCVCYAGYKLVFVALNLLFSCLIDSSLAYMAISLVTGLIAALFMVQTLRPYFKIDTNLMDASQLLASSSRSQMDESSKTYIVFLLVTALLQVLFIQLMGRHVA